MQALLTAQAVFKGLPVYWLPGNFKTLQNCDTEYLLSPHYFYGANIASCITNLTGSAGYFI